MHANRGPRYCLSVSAAHSSTLALTTCRAWWLQSEARAGHGQGQWADSGELVIEPAAATTTPAAAAADRRGDDQGQGQAAEAGSGVMLRALNWLARTVHVCGPTLSALLVHASAALSAHTHTRPHHASTRLHTHPHLLVRPGLATLCYRCVGGKRITPAAWRGLVRSVSLPSASGQGSPHPPRPSLAGRAC